MKAATQNANEVNGNSNILRTISSMGITLANIDSAPIKMNALKLTNVFGEEAEVSSLIKGHHVDELKRNVYRFIGASNLLGNPVNFVNSLGTGVEEFFYLPREGYVRGPLHAGIGFIKGTGSLVKNTFIGAVGSAGGMLSSVSKGLLHLSADKEYINSRDVQAIRNKPKNAYQGLKMGVKSAASGVASGITGVFTNPAEGYDKEGGIGLVTGLFKGAAGLLVKPVSGTLDIISNTTEGFKNTQKTSLELEAEKRLRNPRPFYSKENLIREYNEEHAGWIQWLKVVDATAAQIDLTCFMDVIQIAAQDGQ